MDPITMAVIQQVLPLLTGEGNQMETPQLPNAGGSVNMKPVDDGTKSAHGRTLETFDNEITVDAPQPVQNQVPMPDGLAPIAAPTTADIGGPLPVEGGGEGMKMDPLELAMLGLSLGSGLFQGGESPRAPGLPGSSMAPMRPVFRG